MAQQVFKTPEEQASFLKKDFEKRVGRNPSYSKMAQYARGDDQDISDDYFYAYKDAYEQSPTFNRIGYMNPEEMKSRLSDRYWDMDYQNRLSIGVPESEYDRYYLGDFEKKYGTYDDFVNKTYNAWKRWMNETYGGNSEDHQTFGRYIRENPDKFTTLKQLQDYYEEWDGRQHNYPEFLEFWKNKLFGGK